MSGPSGDRFDDAGSRATDADVDTLRAQDAPAREHRVAGIDVEDAVVACIAAGEVLAPIVDHVVGADGAHEVHLRGAAHARHLSSERLGDLDCERPDVAGRAVDEHAVARLDGSLPGQALERHHSRLRQRRGLLEGQRRRLAREGPLGCQRIVRERPEAELRQVAEHLVAGCEARDERPDRLDDTRHIEAERLVTGAAQSRADAGEPRTPEQVVEVAHVHRGGPDPDEDLVLLRRRDGDIHQLEQFGRAVVGASIRAHRPSVR